MVILRGPGILNRDMNTETSEKTSINKKITLLEKRLSKSENLINEELDESKLSAEEMKDLDEQLAALEAELLHEEMQHPERDKSVETAEVAALANRIRVLEKQLNQESDNDWKKKLRQLIAFMGSTSAVFGFLSIFFPGLRQVVHTTISGFAGVLVVFFTGKKM